MYYVTAHYDVIYYILVKTSNRTLYIHEYNWFEGVRFQCLIAIEPINQNNLIGMILSSNM